MPQTTEQSCHTCLYEKNGTCRRYPPTIHYVHVPRDGDNNPRTDTVSGIWPTVNSYQGSDAWCGEWTQPALVLDNGQT